MRELVGYDRRGVAFGEERADDCSGDPPGGEAVSAADDVLKFVAGQQHPL